MNKSNLVSYIREVDNDRFFYNTIPMEGGTLLQIKDHRRKVGHVHFRINEGIVDIFTFHIEPKYRSQGIGSCILSALVNFFISRRSYTIWIIPFECTIPFYEKVLGRLSYRYEIGYNENNNIAIVIKKEDEEE